VPAPSRARAQKVRTLIGHGCRSALQVPGADFTLFVDQASVVFRKTRLIAPALAGRECRFFLQVALRCRHTGGLSY
jgi:hypothetical protein